MALSTVPEFTDSLLQYTAVLKAGDFRFRVGSQNNRHINWIGILQAHNQGGVQVGRQSR